MCFMKYVVNIMKMVVQRKKVQIEFVVDDITTYKQVSLLATMAFIVVRQILILKHSSLSFT